MTTLLLKKKAIRKSGAAPIYVQVAEILDAEIKLHDDSTLSLPSEGELSREFGVSRVTVRQALKQLEARGVIYSAHGRGYFKKLSRMRGLSGFHSFTSEVRKLGGEPGSIIVDYADARKLPGDFRKHLQAGGDDNNDFICLRRMRTIDGNAIAVETVYLPKSLYPSASRDQFDDASLYAQMTETWGIVPAWTDALFEPTAATSEEAGLLGIEKGAPVLVVWRATVTDTDQVVEYVKSIYKGDGFMLSVSRYRL